MTSSGVTAIERVGATVHRAQGPWSPSVHRLLDRLRAAGFTGSPRFLGVDAADREILDFIDGEVAPYPWRDDSAACDIITSAAKLLRSFHDATVDFAASGQGGWQLPSVEPIEVVCHNDIAPYNCVVRDGVAVAFIDFDTAAPGPRAWDLAYAVYRFAPLSHDFGDALRQRQRARLFLDAYGADPGLREATVRLVPARLSALVEFIEAQARAGNPAYARHIADGDADQYRQDSAYALENGPGWIAGVMP